MSARRGLRAALTAALLTLTLAGLAPAQEGELFTGSGSLADVIRGTHSEPPVTQAGTVGDRVAGYRIVLGGGTAPGGVAGGLVAPVAPADGFASGQLEHRVNALAADAPPAFPRLRRGLWGAIGRAIARAAPLAGGAAIADGPLPFGEILGLGLIVASVATEVVRHVRDGEEAEDEEEGEDGESEEGDGDGDDPPPTSPNRLQREVERGRAPRGVTRVDPANPDVPGSQPHIHYDDGTSSNLDGSVHDAHRGYPNPSNRIRRWIESHGWTAPPRYQGSWLFDADLPRSPWVAEAPRRAA